MTAHQLLDALRAAGVELAADGIVLDVGGRVPPHLAPLLKVLHTGVRAALTGRMWWGSGSERPRVEAISCNQRFPEWVGLVCVEGDETGGGKWDRLPADARIDYPELFEGGKVAAVAGRSA